MNEAQIAIQLTEYDIKTNPINFMKVYWLVGNWYVEGGISIHDLGHAKIDFEIDSCHKFLGFDKTTDVEIKFSKDRSHCYRAIQSFQQRIDRELEKIEAFLSTIPIKN
jgi:hypothetical protein